MFTASSATNTESSDISSSGQYLTLEGLAMDIVPSSKTESSGSFSFAFENSGTGLPGQHHQSFSFPFPEHPASRYLREHHNNRKIHGHFETNVPGHDHPGHDHPGFHSFEFQ
jgi:hypothetical protein